MGLKVVEYDEENGIYKEYRITVIRKKKNKSNSTTTKRKKIPFIDEFKIESDGESQWVNLGSKLRRGVFKIPEIEVRYFIMY